MDMEAWEEAVKMVQNTGYSEVYCAYMCVSMDVCA